MRHIWWFKWIGVLLVTAFLLLAGGITWVRAEGSIVIPPLGVIDDDETVVLDCDGQAVEKRYYDFVPLDPDFWRTVAVGLPGEPNFVMIIHETPGGEGVVYIDSDLDGLAEQTMSRAQLVAESENNWCKAYERYRADE